MVLHKKNNKKIKLVDSKIEEYPIFCFKYLTTNKDYSFKYFQNDKDLQYSKAIILDDIIKLQGKTRLTLGMESKKTGFETIAYNQLNFRPANLDLSSDTKLIVFRINSQNWRLIGYKSDNFKGVLHVIGFDFNYSAYKH